MHRRECGRFDFACGLSWFLGWCPDLAPWTGEADQGPRDTDERKQLLQNYICSNFSSASAQKKLERPRESMFTSGLKRHPIRSGFY